MLRWIFAAGDEADALSMIGLQSPDVVVQNLVSPIIVLSLRAAFAGTIASGQSLVDRPHRHRLSSRHLTSPSTWLIAGWSRLDLPGIDQSVRAGESGSAAIVTGHSGRTGQAISVVPQVIHTEK